MVFDLPYPFKDKIDLKTFIKKNQKLTNIKI